MPNFVISKNIPEYNSEDILVAHLDGKKCKTLEKFFKSIASELKFPDYFGNNLDSFDEMINDLTWLEEEAVIIIIKNLESLLIDAIDESEEDEDYKGLILSLLDQAADDQKNIKDGLPIKIIVEKSTISEEYLDGIGIEYLKN